MKYQVVAAGAALAPLAAGAIHQGHRHQHLHHKRDVETHVDWAYTTITRYVTAGGENEFGQPSFTPSYEAPPSSDVAASSSASPVQASDNASAPPPSSSTLATSSMLASSSPTTPSSIVNAVAESSTTAVSTSYSFARKRPFPSKKASSSHSVAAAPSSYAASSTSSAPSSGSTGITKDNLTPNGRKAGLSGYVGIQDLQAFSDLAPYISWYSDYTPNTPTVQNVKGIGMLWGADGSACGSITTPRLNSFNKMETKTVQPEIMFGFYEPDCYCDMSSEMDASAGTAQWNALLAPMASQGTVLGSPSMCKQKDEDWLQPFMDGGIDAEWDVTSLHINKPDLQGVKDDVEYYLATYKKPLWINEFACVDDENAFTACTDQDQINQFIYDAVSFFEGNESVVAYGPSNGAGLGTVWPLTDDDGNLSATGQTYLNAIKGL